MRIRPTPLNHPAPRGSPGGTRGHRHWELSVSPATVVMPLLPSRSVCEEIPFTPFGSQGLLVLTGTQGQLQGRSQASAAAS